MEIDKKPLEFKEEIGEDLEDFIKSHAPDPEVGVLSALMLLNDIFLLPYIRSLVSKFLIEKYSNLLLLKHIFRD